MTIKEAIPDRMAQFCPGCYERDRKIDRLERERDERSTGPAKVEYPELAAFVGHCESGHCNHATEWAKWKEDFLADKLGKLPDDFIRTQALARNILPKRIVIPQGLTS